MKKIVRQPTSGKTDLQKLVRDTLNMPQDEESKSFIEEIQEEYMERMIRETGLVWCCTCQRFIDDQSHNINHVFARGLKEIREKTIIEKMLGRTEK